MTQQREEFLPKKIAVIGGGIAGVAAAHRLVELSPECEVKLFEASDALGGVLQTKRIDGYLIEQSADNFITNIPGGIDLCRRIGFADQLLKTDDRFRKAMVVHDGKLVDVPEGFALMAPAKMWSVLSTPILSWAGKLRLAGEFFLPPREGVSDESLASFAQRRLGREVYERLVQPLVGGIYTADPEQLSLAATLPRFLEMERRHGGLIRGMLEQPSGESSSNGSASGARYSLFVAPRDGMSSFVAALAEKLPAGCVQLRSRVTELAQGGTGVSPVPKLGEAFPNGGHNQPQHWQHASGTLDEHNQPPHWRNASDTQEKKRSVQGWSLSINDEAPQHFDAVIVALPAAQGAKLLAGVSGELATRLAKIPSAGASVVSVGYDRKQISHPLDVFGFVVPAIENRKILAASFSSVKYAGRAPQGKVLIRVFVGGACQSEIGELPDDELKAIVRRELSELIGAQGEPELWHITRWQGAMPQYHLGHVELVNEIFARAAALPNFALAGNAYRGVGIPQCIQSGEAAAAKIIRR